jgi:hypothetical protein
MEDIRRIAFETVMRACAFGSLAIFCFMVGLSFEPQIAFKTGGVLTLIMVAILLFKAREALTKNHRKTEMWLYLPKAMRPPEAYAQRITSTIMRETYLVFALWTAEVALAMWLVALVLSLASG